MSTVPVGQKIDASWHSMDVKVRRIGGEGPLDTLFHISVRFFVISSLVHFSFLFSWMMIKMVLSQKKTSMQ